MRKDMPNANEVRLFGKLTTRKHRRMGVALASGGTVDEARERARQAADWIQITYEG
jgi:phosphoribosylglycinamide formyltransferase 2